MTSWLILHFNLPDLSNSLNAAGVQYPAPGRWTILPHSLRPYATHFRLVKGRVRQEVGQLRHSDVLTSLVCRKCIPIPAHARISSFVCPNTAAMLSGHLYHGGQLPLCAWLPKHHLHNGYERCKERLGRPECRERKLLCKCCCGSHLQHPAPRAVCLLVVKDAHGDVVPDGGNHAEVLQSRATRQRKNLIKAPVYRSPMEHC